MLYQAGHPRNKQSTQETNHKHDFNVEYHKHELNAEWLTVLKRARSKGDLENFKPI